MNYTPKPFLSVAANARFKVLQLRSQAQKAKVVCVECHAVMTRQFSMSKQVGIMTCKCGCTKFVRTPEGYAP